MRKMSKLFVSVLALVSIAAFAGYGHGMKNKKTITQIAAGNKNFTTLVAALKAAGLAKVLNKPGHYTVFAPTNAAFNKLPKGTVKTLLKPQNKKKLTNILLYHVVNGKVYSYQIKPGSVKTLEGQRLHLNTKHGKVMVNNAQVTGADIKASNGVIHVINRVLIPKA